MRFGRRRTSDDSSKKNEKNGTPNVIISSTGWLSAIIRYFSGGDPVDIALIHGISHTEGFNSTWEVVDAVNKCPKLDNNYSTNFMCPGI